MDVRRTHINTQEAENRILARIVDAMYASQTELSDATEDQWSQILLDACRRRKESAVSERYLAATTPSLDADRGIRRMAV